MQVWVCRCKAKCLLIYTGFDYFTIHKFWHGHKALWPQLDVLIQQRLVVLVPVHTRGEKKAKETEQKKAKVNHLTLLSLLLLYVLAL